MEKTDNLLNANTISFSGIISSDNIYQVPLFQRDYSWVEDNWDDLWLDIQNAINDNTRHYMGSIVLIKKGIKLFEIIDGQQRLTTLSILALSCIKILNELIQDGIDKENNLERKDILMRKFIGYKSPSSLLFSNKIKLNNENNPVYSSYLIQFDEVNNYQRLTKSNKLLIDAYNFFYNKLKNEVYNNDGSAIEIVEYLEYVGDHLQFIQITVVDELNAYLVFETLNDRGIPLTVTDLFKNFLFSKIPEADHEHIKNKWDNILRFVKYKDFASFLRYFWISRNRLVTEKEMFKAVKKSLNDTNDVLQIISDLEIHSELFNALSDPHDDLWKGKKEIIKYLCELQLYNIKQPYPLLMVSFEKLKLEDFERVLEICSVISFRYTVICGFKTNIIEQVYNRAAIKVFNGQIKYPREILNELRQLYVADEIFQNSFTLKSIKTSSKSSLVRYILYSIENHISNNPITNYNEDDGTIEHILPENPDERWGGNFVKDIQKDFIYRLGNYTLLERKLNNECEGHKIEIKKGIYQKSKYKMSQDFEYDLWNPQKLKHRQAKLAKYAKQLWRLNY